MSPSRLQFPARAALALCLAAAALVPCGARSADYPVRPLRIIVPYPPGGATDVVTRLAGEVLHERMGQAVVVENRPGADGVIGVDATIKAGADGYTLTIMPGASLITLPILKKNVPFDPLTDLAPLSMVFKYGQILAVNSEVPVKTLSEWVAYVKANPGKLNRGVIGTGVLLQAAITDTALGIQGLLVPVNYKGNSLAGQALMANEVQFMNSDLTTVTPGLKSGRIRVLAVTTPTRMPALPDAPTVAETLSPGFELTSVFGFFAPAGTPREVVQKLSAEFAALSKSGPVNDYIVNKIAAIPVGSTADELAQWMRSDFAREKQAAQQLKVQPE